LDHRIWLEQFASREAAEKLAPLFRSGYFQILEEKATHKRSLVYASLWADESAAQAFLDQCRAWMPKAERTAREVTVHAQP